MDIKPIKNDQDHWAALAEIERLMDAQLETPEGDRLDALTQLVEAWEEEHYPIGKPETRLAALRQALKEGEEKALKEGEESGRADYSLKELLDELDGDTP